jgi:hypothetical protein
MSGGQSSVIAGLETKHKNFYPPKQLSNPVADPLLELEQLWSLDDEWRWVSENEYSCCTSVPKNHPGQRQSSCGMSCALLFIMDGKDRWDAFSEMDIGHDMFPQYIIL